MDLNDTIYNRYLDSNYCQLYNNTCYYDTRYINQTLTLYKPVVSIGSVLGLYFLSAGVFVNLLLVIGFVCYIVCYPKKKLNDGQ
jgi:hypothetical protein